MIKLYLDKYTVYKDGKLIKNSKTNHIHKRIYKSMEKSSLYKKKNDNHFEIETTFASVEKKLGIYGKKSVGRQRMTKKPKKKKKEFLSIYEEVNYILRNSKLELLEYEDSENNIDFVKIVDNTTIGFENRNGMIIIVLDSMFETRDDFLRDKREAKLLLRKLDRILKKHNAVYEGDLLSGEIVRSKY